MLKHAFVISISFFSCNLIWSQSRLIAHLTRPDGAFQTQILFDNVSLLTENLSLIPFLEDGTQLSTIQMEFEPEQTLMMTPQQVFNREDVSHFEVEGSEFVRVSVLYQYTGGASSPVPVQESQTEGTGWRLYPTSFQDADDGFAVVNLDDEPQAIVVKQYDFNHQLVDQATLFDGNLGSKAKGLFLFDSLFERGDNRYFDILSEKPVHVLALRFAVQCGYFWETPLNAVPSSMGDGSGPQVGAVAVLNTRFHGVSGTVTVSGKNQLRIDDFHYDGLGPDVYVYLGKNFGFVNGVAVGTQLEHRPYEGETMTIETSFDITQSGYDSVSIWCVLAVVDFGSGRFQMP